MFRPSLVLLSLNGACRLIHLVITDRLDDDDRAHVDHTDRRLVGKYRGLTKVRPGML